MYFICLAKIICIFISTIITWLYHFRQTLQDNAKDGLNIRIFLFANSISSTHIFKTLALKTKFFNDMFTREILNSNKRKYTI